MTKYVDLHIVPPVEDTQSCEQMARLLRLARYSMIGLTVPTGLLRDRIKLTRNIFDQQGVDTALRVDISSSSRTELLRSLRRFRNLYDLVAVKCVNQRVATVACRDRRVDIIFFDTGNPGLRFTHPFAGLLRGVIEFNLVSDVVARWDRSAISRMRKAIAIAREHKVNVVLSSGARSPKLIRTPIQISALATILGLPHEQSVNGMTSLASSIISTNLNKRKPEYVEEGVRIILPRGR